MSTLGKLAAGAVALFPCLSAAVSRGDRSAGSPGGWPAGEYERFLKAQETERTRADVATGRKGAVTVAYNGLAARAGLEAMRQGGNALDAALTAAITQVALTAGAPVSYFGILSLVYYDAETGKVYTMNAEWNTVRGETEPTTLPGSISMASEDGLRGTAVSGRTALVGGFMKGVGAAHRRFGKIRFSELFSPAIYIAENGMPVTRRLADKLRFRGQDLRRLPETRAVFTRPDGKFYEAGDIFRQPALARTLRAVAAQGTDYMYKGPWAKKLVAAVQADGGKMTLEDLAAYDVIWDEPLVATIGDYEVYTNPPPNGGGVALVEAQNLAAVSGLATGKHWSESAASLRKALEISQVSLLPEPMLKQTYPKLDFSPASRTTSRHAQRLWQAIQAGAQPMQWEMRGLGHSDDVVAIDQAGNIAAITHSINCVDWGKTAIFVDGVSIGDPASFQQAAIAKLKPGARLPAPTQTGILFQGGKPVLGFASMGSGLHQRTFQCLLNFTRFGMTVDQAIDSPDFLMPGIDPRSFKLTVQVPKGRFPKAVLDELGFAYREYDASNLRFGGEGIWVAISRDPKPGQLRAASHNRHNSAAVAW